MEEMKYELEDYACWGIVACEVVVPPFQDEHQVVVPHFQDFSETGGGDGGDGDYSYISSGGSDVVVGGGEENHGLVIFNDEHGVFDEDQNNNLIDGDYSYSGIDEECHDTMEELGIAEMSQSPSESSSLVEELVIATPPPSPPPHRNVCRRGNADAAAAAARPPPPRQRGRRRRRQTPARAFTRRPNNQQRLIINSRERSRVANFNHILDDVWKLLPEPYSNMSLTKVEKLKLCFAYITALRMNSYYDPDEVSNLLQIVLLNTRHRVLANRNLPNKTLRAIQWHNNN